MTEKDDNTIELTLRGEGYTIVRVDKNEYESAKQDGELDSLLDCHLSDMDIEKWVVEPDGSEVYL